MGSKAAQMEKKPGVENRVAMEIEQEVVGLAIERPAWG
jgi:hypothetical protein